MREELEARLRSMPRDARARVEDALHKTLEAEISGEIGRANDPAAAFSRSKGLAFSRSKCLVARGTDVFDSTLVSRLATMETAKFEEFARRLSVLRSRSF
jgi:hypothetical protein